MKDMDIFQLFKSLYFDQAHLMLVFENNKILAF